MVWTVIGVIIDIIVDYIAYIFMAAVYIYSNNQSRQMASRARRLAAAAQVGADRDTMIKQPITSHKIVYGQCLVSGPITFMSTSDDGEYLNILITLAAHEVAAIHDVYFNDEIIPLDEDGRVRGKYSDVAVIKKGLGTEAGDAVLHAYITAQVGAKWTSAHRQTGHAKLFVRLKFDMDLYPTGIPNVSAVVSGKKLFDPRTNATYYSNNAALCIRDYLTSARHGLGAGEYVHGGTAQSAGSSDITLATSASAVDDAYQYMIIRIVGGTGIDQERIGTGYVGATKVLAVDRPWDVALDSTSLYTINDPTEEIDGTAMAIALNACEEQVALAGQSDTFVIGNTISNPEYNTIVDDPTASISGTLQGYFRYAVSFLDGVGETLISPGSIGIGVGTHDADGGAADWGVRLSRIPLGTAGVTSRRIYRCVDTGPASRLSGPYYLIGTIADNTTTTFDDTGYANGAAAPTANTTDPNEEIVRSTVSPYIQTGDVVRLTTTGTLPTGLALATDYYAIYTGMYTVKLATSLANAFAGTAVTITSAGSGVHTVTKTSEMRFACNGSVDTDLTPKSLLGELLTSLGGRLIYTGGKWTLQPAIYNATAGVIDEDDLDGSIKTQTLVGKRDLCNGVKGVFINPAVSWQPNDFPPITNATYTAEDRGERMWRDIQLPYTTTPSAAQRLAKIELEKVRQQITTVWPCKLTVLKYQPGDTVSLTNARAGWTEKAFEITGYNMVLRETDPPRLGIDLTLRETAAAIYDWNSGEETTIDPAPNTDLPDPTVVDQIVGLAAESGTNQLYINSDGHVETRIYLSWTAIVSQYVLSGGHIEIEYRPIESTSGLWSSISVMPDETGTHIASVEDGVGYYLRVRAVNSLGVRGPWAPILHFAVGKTQLPSNVTGFSAAQNGNVVVLRWDQVADLDLAGYEIRYITQGGTNWDAATSLTRVTRGTQITTAGVPPGAWTLLIKARDTSQNYSATAASYAIDMSNAFNVVQEVVDDPDFIGAKTNFVHHWTGYLVPDSQDAASLDSWSTFDQFVPNPAVTCSYVSSSDIDILFEDSVRVWADMSAVLGPEETTGFPNPRSEIDYHSGGGFDGYESWTIGSLITRYVRSKLVLLPADGLAYVSRFRTTVDVEGHTETGVGVVIGASGTAILFTDRFHFAPSIQLTVQGAGLFAGFTGDSGTGFTAHVYNAAGTEVGGTINWTATGE